MLVKSEQEVWNHYRDYLIEATKRSAANLSVDLSNMKKSVSEGCSRQELKEMMLELFEPITIMQSLEQWQNQMDILLYTGIKELSGVSREEYYDIGMGESPYVLVDGVLDLHSPDIHIYDLSSTTQDVLHMTSERAGRNAPGLIIDIQKEAGLESNWEIQMLLGDCYRQIGEFKKACSVYNDLWEQNGHADLSIQDAITFTRYAEKMGDGLMGRQFEEWIDDYHDFKKNETVRRSSPKISRNDPCPCGSGKKYKKCCGR